MLLYHGTTAEVAKLALTEGLRPRADLGRESNWKEHPSREDLVYLTTAYAPYFALCATDHAEEGEWAGIVEVETDELDWAELLPDEDYLNQAGREFVIPDDIGSGSDARTAWFRENIDDFGDYAESSLENIGNVAYRGIVPPAAVTRVVVFDPDWNRPVMQTATDPSISIVNYRYMRHKYVALTEWFMGARGDVDQIAEGIAQWMLFDPAQGHAMRERWIDALADRSGWKMLKGEPQRDVVEQDEDQDKGREEGREG